MSRHGSSNQSNPGFLGRVTRLWKRLPEGFRWNLEDTFQPEDIGERLLPGEEPQLEIHLAWYRDILGIMVFDYFRWFLGLALVTSMATALFAFLRGAEPLGTFLYASIPFVLLLLLSIAAIRTRVEHNQWRLLKTNARFIISIPQPGSFPLVDNIELKNPPVVIDTNWSPNPLWRIFQFFSGARDLYISLAAYRFVEGTARVGDALVIPDVMPADVLELKRLVFRVPPSSPPPQKVVFPSPQDVVIKRDDSQ